MPLEVKIRRKLKGFALDVSFRTDREVMIGAMVFAAVITPVIGG